MKPLITALVDTYNHEKYIEQALASVLEQGLSPAELEIVVVDDGSTDGTASIIQKFVPRVKHIRKKNAGQASALNVGISTARGEFLSLLDGDDFFHRGKLVRVLDAFQKRPNLGMVYHRLLQWDMRTDERREYSGPMCSGDIDSTPDIVFTYVPHPTSCLSFRRDMLDRMLPIPEALRIQADGYLGAMIILVAPILAIPECLATYRVHGDNLYYDDQSCISPNTLKKRLEPRQILLDAMHQWVEANALSRKPPVRSFLDRWKLFLQGDEFQLKAPGRFRFFSHLLLYNRCYGPYQSPRLRMINRINAVGALALGYKHFRWLEQGRLALVGAVKRIFAS